LLEHAKSSFTPPLPADTLERDDDPALGWLPPKR
jgi:hypothetical protein